MRRWLGLLLVLAMASPSWAAVAYVSGVANNDSSSVPVTLTLTNVVGSGGNEVIACFSWRKNLTQVMTGATYGGAAMTQIATEIATSGGAMACWRYENPSGTQNVVGTWDAAPPNMQGVAMVFSGVDANGTPVGTSQTGIVAGGTSLSATITMPSSGMGVDCFFLRGNPTDEAPGAQQTSRHTAETGGSMMLACSTEPSTGDGTMTWSWTTNYSGYTRAIPLNAAAGGGAAETFGFRLRVIQ